MRSSSGGRVLAVANQKGGVAKTTTTHSLGVAVAETGGRVLLVDLDPQACLTFSCGVDGDQLDKSIHDVFLGRDSAETVRLRCDSVDLLPANIDLAGSEVHLMSRTGREYVLRRALEPLAEDYDLILLDCPPSLGILTINGLTAATAVVIPLQCETLSYRGVGQLQETIDDVRTYTNAELKILGVIPTMYDGRTNLARQVIDSVMDAYDLPILDPPVPKSVKVAEAPGQGRSVLTHAPRSKAAEAYRSLAKVVMKS